LDGFSYRNGRAFAIKLFGFPETSSGEAERDKLESRLPTASADGNLWATLVAISSHAFNWTVSKLFRKADADSRDRISR
jgi:hypothetical protein